MRFLNFLQTFGILPKLQHVNENIRNLMQAWESRQTWSPGVFWVGDFDFVIRFLKFAKFWNFAKFSKFR